MSDQPASTNERTPPDRRLQLETLLRKKAAKSRSFPLSFAQQRLWVLDQFDPGNPVYNVPLAVRLTGTLNIDVLNRTLNEIVARHESLRTRIAKTDDQPVQVVDAARRQELTVIDLEHFAPAEREAAALARATAESRAPFRLEDGPLFRTLLLRLSPDEHVFVVVMHHIISDDWSMGVLVREVALLYHAYLAGEPSPLKKLGIQYADYAVWHRQRLQGEVLERQLDYWCRQLQGVTPLELPADRPRQLVDRQAGATIDVVLPATLAKQLKELARRAGATLYMTLLAAFQVLLYRYSGQEDFAVGSPIAGRTRSETEGVVGFFVNTLVLRANLAGSPTFRQLLGQVRQTALEAFEHQELPFERLVEALNPERDASRHPVFQVMFTLQNAPWPDVKFGGLTLSVIPLDTATSKFDLSFTAREESHGLALSVEYYSDLFEAATMERMVGHFQQLLRGIVAEPDCPVARLPLLGDDEQRQLLVQWNETAGEFDGGQGLQQLFETHAERSPDATAVVGDDRRWTYGELHRRANQLARYLQRQGVGPEVRVGLCLERSPELVWAVLGVLKAGGAYVPLDVAYTQDAAERTRFVLEDAQVSLVLTQSALSASLPGCGVPQLVLDGAAAERIGGESGEQVDGGTGADSLAYILYTSGSTGRPKGVMVTHGNLRNAYYGWEQAYGLARTCASICRWPVSASMYSRVMWCGPSARAARW